MKRNEEKLYTLAYADDIVLLVENEEMKCMMIIRLERYLDRTGLVLNVDKSKVMRFRKGGGRIKKIGWY